MWCPFYTTFKFPISGITFVPSLSPWWGCNPPWGVPARVGHHHFVCPFFFVPNIISLFQNFGINVTFWLFFSHFKKPISPPEIHLLKPCKIQTNQVVVKIKRAKSISFSGISVMRSVLSVESPFLDHYELVFPAYLKSLLCSQNCQETESPPLETSAANKTSVPPYWDYGRTISVLKAVPWEESWLGASRRFRLPPWKQIFPENQEWPIEWGITWRTSSISKGNGARKAV